MTREELLYGRLTSYEPLTSLLAQYGSGPAVFLQSAPSDQDDGWKGNQYPRVDFVVDLRADPERGSSGVLTVNLWCAESGRLPEELSPQLCAALEGGFFCPDGEAPFSLSWARSEPFDGRSQANPDTLVVGLTLQYDLYAFPVGLTSDPDPVQALWEWMRDRFPEVLVVGRDVLREEYRPMDERPAFYFRVLSLVADEETNTVCWMKGMVAAHIFTPTAQGRLRWLRAAVDTLAIEREVTMADGAPMFLKNISADSAADPMAQGQLKLTVRFGILRRPELANPLRNPNYNRR